MNLNQYRGHEPPDPKEWSSDWIPILILGFIAFYFFGVISNVKCEWVEKPGTFQTLGPTPAK